MTGMKEYFKYVMGFHPSQKSMQQHSFPRVALRRLSPETLKKHTGTDYISHCKSPSRKESSPSLESSLQDECRKEDENSSDAPSECEDIDTSPRAKEGNLSEESDTSPRAKEGNLSEESDTSPRAKEGNLSEESDTSPRAKEGNLSEESDTSPRAKEGNLSEESDDEPEVVDSDALTSSNSDDLPNLMDLSWTERPKKKQLKRGRRKKEKKDLTFKTDTKLMKSARKAFQHQAVRYKSFKQFMKSTKTYRDIQQTESKSPGVDSHCGLNVASEVEDCRFSNTESQPLHKKSAPSTTTLPAIQDKDKRRNIDSAEERPAISERITLELKESMTRYVGQEEANSGSDDITNVEVQPLNAIDEAQFVQQQSSQVEDSDASGESNDSGCTVLFEDSKINDSYTAESSHTLMGKSSIGSRSFLTTEGERKTLCKKRKNSPLTEESEMTKRKRHDDRQEIVSAVDKNQPMVVRPLRISSPICLSPTFGTSLSASCLVSPAVCEQVSSQVNEAAQLGNKENDENFVKENEASELPCKISSVVSVAADKSINLVDAHPSYVSENEHVLVDITSSQEDDNSPATVPEADGRIFVTVSNITSLSGNGNPTHKNTDRQEKSINTIKQKMTSSTSKETESQQKETNNSSKGPAIDFKMKMKQLSSEFNEKNVRKAECDKEINQLKQEYNSRLEALEEKKKSINLEIEKLVDAFRDLSKELDSQEGTPDSNPSDDAGVMKDIPTSSATAPAADIAAVQLPTTKPVVKKTPIPIQPKITQVTPTIPKQPDATLAKTPTPNTSDNRSSEKLHINVIPAANIRNFGTEKTCSFPKEPSQDPCQLTYVPVLPPKDSKHKEIRGTGLRYYRHTSNKHPQQQAGISLPSQSNLKVITASMSAPHVPKNQTQRKTSQETVTPLSSSSGSGDCSGNSVQFRSDITHHSSFDKQIVPPNAVVIDQRPVMTASHVMCAAPPRSVTNTAHRRGLITQTVRTVPSGCNNPANSQLPNVTFQVHQNGHYVPLQDFIQKQPQILQQMQSAQSQQHQDQHQQQQGQRQFPSNAFVIQHQQNNSHFFIQKYQPVPDQLQNNPTQGQAIPTIYTAPVNNNSVNCTTAQMANNFTQNTDFSNGSNTTRHTNSIAVNQSQRAKALISGIHKKAYTPVVNSSNLSHMQHQPQSVGPAAGLSSASHASTSMMTTPTLSTGQLTPESLPRPASQTAEDVSQESGPRCVVCGSTGIFICCNDVIYCSTTCQGNDWSIHKDKCTNTTSS